MNVPGVGYVSMIGCRCKFVSILILHLLCFSVFGIKISVSRKLVHSRTFSPAPRVSNQHFQTFGSDRHSK